MDLTLFCAAFIIQFVGHRIGDYFLQTGWQANNKAQLAAARLRHCVVYTLVISALLFFILDWRSILIIFIITFIEHFIIDSRKPVISWILFLETEISNSTSMNKDNIPGFLVLEFDQTIHYIRMFVISLLLGYGIL